MPKREESLFIQQNNQSAQRMVDKDIFYVDNYGGINQESSPVNIPYTDTPDMVNFDTTLSGNLKKRSGSILRNFTNLNYGHFPRGQWLGSITLPTGEVCVVLKTGVQLDIYLMDEKYNNTLSTRIFVVSTFFLNEDLNDTENTVPDVVVTNEENPRIIFATGVAPVLECQVTMRTMLVNASGLPYENVNTGETLDMFIQGTTSAAISSTATVGSTITYTPAGGVTFTPYSRVTFVSFSNSVVWLESMRRTSDQIMGTNFRYNLYTGANPNTEEKLVQIPLPLQRGSLEDARLFGMSYGTLPYLVLSQNTATSTAFSYANPPTTATEYAFSDGMVQGATTDYVTFGSSYISFGSLAASGSAATPVYFHRKHFLYLSGGAGIVNGTQGLFVQDNLGVTWTQDLNTTRQAHTTSDKKYLLYTSDGINIDTTGTSTVYGIGFTADYPQGLNCDWVEITSQNYFFLTGSANARLLPPFYYTASPRFFRPIYGLGMFQKEGAGIFVKYLSMFQNRLAISGFRHDPLLVVLSNTNDEGSYFNYQNFDTLYSDSSLATSPIEFRLSSTHDDYVTGMVEWQGSLFVFTRRGVWRVHGGGQAVTPTNVQVDLVSNAGCVSHRTIVRTDRNVHYLSDAGFYKLDLVVELGNYFAEDISIKIHKHIRETKGWQTGGEFTLDKAWAFYNQGTDSIWLALPDTYETQYTRKMLVYNAKRDAWTRYCNESTYFFATAGCSTQGRTFILNNWAFPEVNAELDEDTNGAWTYLMEYDRDDLIVDFYQTATYAALNGAGHKVIGYRYHHGHITLHTGQAHYQLDASTRHYDTGYSYAGLILPPVENCYSWIRVELWNSGLTIGRDLVGGTDYVLNYATNTLKILCSYIEGDKLLITSHRDDENSDPSGGSNDMYTGIVVYEDGLILDSVDIDKVLGAAADGGNITLTFDAGHTPDSNSDYFVGVYYPCWHVTPTFFREQNSRLKRTTHYVGYYDNRNYNEMYQAYDVNTGAGQTYGELTGKFRVQAGVSVAFHYNDTRTGYVSEDVYRGQDLIWDMSVFGIGESINQESEVCRIRETILGLGYSFAVCNFNFSPRGIELVGWQVETKMGGKNSRGNW